jgi:DNA primase
MLIPEEKVQEILERTDIVALVARSVELKRAGRSLRALCPFHGERTPSFYVSPERRRFKCFGCGVGGDAIAFVMRQQGIGFVEAARSLASQAGVRLEAGADDKLMREKLDLRRVHELAVRFYSERLGDERAGKLGREHLVKRGITAETARAFGLGYAPAAWGELAARCAKEGVAELALRAGLLSPRNTSSGQTRPGSPDAYDFFRGRLMIPIRSPEGSTVGFGGRVVEGDDDRKFINSRESAIFKKGELLFAIDAAREPIRKSGQAILVEGYFDAIALHQQGLRNAVALCSASLTPEQVKLLRRCEARELILILDGDEAGRRGVSKAAGPLLAMGMPARVVVLPAGVDPDEHVLAIGGDAFRASVAAAPALTEHLVQSALPAGKTASFEEKLKALATLQPILGQIPEGLERSLFLQVLSQGLGVPEADLRARLGDAPTRPAPPSATGSARRGTPEEAGSAGRRAEAKGRSTSIDPIEEIVLVAHLLVEPALARLPDSDVLEELAHAGLRAVAAEQIQAAVDGQPMTADEILEGLDPRLAGRVQQIMRIVLAQPEGARREEFRLKCQGYRQRIARREEEQIQRQLAALGKEISRQQQSGLDAATLQPLLDEHLSLTQQKKALAVARRGRTPAEGTTH